MTVTVGGYEVSKGHAAMWREVGRNEAREEAGRQAREEAAGYRVAALAEQQREAYELARAQADRAHAAAEAAAQREADERRAAAEDYTAMLQVTGQGRWRTVSEVLQAARGLPATYPDATYPAAQMASAERKEGALAALAGGPAWRSARLDDADYLLAASRAGAREWDSRPLRRIRAAALESELRRGGGYGHRVVTTAAGPRWADPDPPRELVRGGVVRDDDGSPLTTEYGLPALVRWLPHPSDY